MNEVTLPPQASAADTSNWDDRAFTTPSPKVAEVVFFREPLSEAAIDAAINPYELQESQNFVLEPPENPTDT